MKSGFTLAINHGFYNPDYKQEYNQPDGFEIFDTNKIFDFKWFRDDKSTYGFLRRRKMLMNRGSTIKVATL